MRRLPAALLVLCCGYLLAGWIRELVYLISRHATFPGGGEPIEHMGFASVALFSILGLVSGLRELFFRPGVPEAGRKLGPIAWTLRAIGWVLAGFGAVGVSTMVTTPDMTITPDGLAIFWSGAVFASVLGGTLLFVFRKGPVSPAYLCLFGSGSIGMIFALVPLWLPLIFVPVWEPLAKQGWQVIGDQGLQGMLSLYRENAIPPESSPTLKRIFRPLSITLADSEVTDISALRGLTNLSQLHLAGTRVSDLSPLRDSLGLQELDLSYSDVTDVGPLREMKSLGKLVLTGTNVTDVSALRGLSNLVYLDLRSTPVGDIHSLRELTHLTTLTLGATNVDDIAPVRELGNLETLDLGYTPVADISALSGLTHLKNLALNNTNVTDITALRGLGSLQELDLSNTPVTDVSALRELKNLTRLVLTGSGVTDVSGFEDHENLDIFQP